MEDYNENKAIGTTTNNRGEMKNSNKNERDDEKQNAKIN